MALQTKVGSFTKPITPGSQAITGIGFQPKAIIFWTAGSTAASGTWNGQIAALLGFTTGAANSYCTFAASSDNVATSNTTRRIAAKPISMTYQETLYDEADLTSFDSDGFTLNWTAATNAAWGGVVIMYMALGGSDITNAKIVAWTNPASAINQAVTGVGFKPDLVFHAGANRSAIPNSAGNSQFGFGVMNKHGQQWTNAFIGNDAVNPSNTSRYQQTDACFSITDEAEVLRAQAHFVSMDADGFTTNFSSTVNGSYVISLCLKGVSSKIGAMLKPSGAAPASQSTTRVRFQPKAVLLSSINTTPLSAPANTGVFSLGISDGTTQRCAALIDRDNVTPIQAQSVWVNNGSYYEMNAGVPPTIASLGSITSLDADGFTTTFNPNFADNPEILYLALGDANVNTYPSTIRSDTTNMPTTSTAYSNQRKIDRCQNGVLWAAYDYAGTAAGNGAAQLRYSTDNGSTWTDSGFIMNGSGATAQNYVRNCSIFIDLDDYMHAVFKDNYDGLIYYQRGTPDAGRTSYTFSASQRCTSNSGSGFNYPDLVAHREGTGWTVHVIMGFSDTTPGNGTYCTRFTITSGGVITRTNDADTLNTPSYPGYAVNVNTYPSIDFNHTGDGKTVAGGTPHLYAAWSAGTTGTGKGIRFRKAVYSGGSWTWNPEREMDANRYLDSISYRWLNCLFDGTRVIIGGCTYDGSAADTILYERDAADTANVGARLLYDNYNALYSGSMSYDAAGNIYMISSTSSMINLVKWTRATSTFTDTQIEPTGNPTAFLPYVSAKRGYSNSRVEWIYTTGNNSPYAVKYDYVPTSIIGLFIKKVKSVTELYRDKMRARGFNI